MKTRMISCSMCGHRFNPEENRICDSCPMQSGCLLSCCPRCGFEVVDPYQSKVGRWLSRVLSLESGEKHGVPETTLVNISPGCLAKVTGFAKDTPPQRRAQLQANGVVPGHTVLVLQHKPVTVLEIDHLELAIEDELAEWIFVDKVEGKENDVIA